MRSKTNILNPDLHNYLLTILPPVSPELQAIYEDTQKHPYKEMQVAPEQGTLLKWLVSLIQPKTIVEIGVFTGYSTLSMAEALSTGSKILACDKNQDWTDVGKVHWKKSPHADKINLHIGDGVDYLKQLIAISQEVDMIFIDADKPNYKAYYELSLELLKPGGILILDNIFLMGRVVTDGQDKQTANIIRELNTAIKTDPRVLPSIIPIGDGMTLLIRQ